MWSKNKRGFSLIELLVTILVIMIGFLGVTNLFVTVIARSHLTTDKLTAAYLVQEGIEIVRNIRDTNWLNDQTGATWLNGILCCGGHYCECEGAFDSSSLVVYQNRYLLVNNGVFNYTSGETTPFKRKIIIDNTQDSNTIFVTVEVTWADPRGSHLIKAREDFYNWIAAP